jgi:hypothetical protein
VFSQWQISEMKKAREAGEQILEKPFNFRRGTWIDTMSALACRFN